MTDIVERLRTAIHLESAAIAPQTSAMIEAAREAADEIERLRAERDKLFAKNGELANTLGAENLRLQKLVKSQASDPSLA
jgi:hypothetical protein